MQPSQAELSEQFRRSFSPITQLAAGRLQLAQMAEQRQYAEQVEMARREQAMRDHLAGITLQNNFVSERDRATQAFQQLLAKQAQDAAQATQLAVGKQNSQLNAEAQRAAASANELRQLQDSLVSLGLDPTAYQGDSGAMRTAAAAKMAKGRSSATQIYSDIADLDTQLEKLAVAAEVPEARALQIAKSQLLSGVAGDDKKSKEYAKLNTLDAVLAAAGGEMGVTDKIEKALQGEQALRVNIYEKRARPILSRQTMLQRTLQTLEGRGISPDYDQLRAIAAPPVSADENFDQGPSAAGPVSSASPVSSAAARFAAAMGGAPEAPPAAESAAPGNSRALEAGAAATLAAVAGKKALSKSLPARAIARLAASRVGAAAGPAGRYIATRAPAALTPLTAGLATAAAINDIPTFFGGEPLSASAAGMMTDSFDESLAQTRGHLATLQGLIQSAQDPAVAGRLRALRYAPVLNDFEIRKAMNGAMPSNLPPIDWLGM